MARGRVFSHSKQGRRGKMASVPEGISHHVGRLGRRGGTSEVQSVTVSGATVGNIRLTFLGQQTGNIAFNANAAAVEAALVALSNVDPGDIVASGGPLNTAPVTLTFGGKYARGDVAQITVQNVDADGTRSTATTTPGATQYGPDPDQVSSFVGKQMHSGAAGPPFYQHPSRRE